jgi:hypothetical protein
MLVGAIALAYGWTLNAHFVADDFGLIERFNTQPWSAWPGLFFRDWSYGIWAPQHDELRPISALAFMIDGWLWGTDAAGFHLTNLVLHLVCSALVMLIALEVFNQDRMRALAAGLVFALHPVPAAAVTWISARVDLLSTAGMLLGFLAFLRYRREASRCWLVLAWGALGFGVFAKESSLLLPAIAIAHDLTLGRRRAGRWGAIAPYAGWLAVMTVYAYCRSFEMSAITAGALADVGPLGMLSRLVERSVPYALALFVAPTLLFHIIPLAAFQELVVGLVGIAAMGGAAAWAISGWRRRDASIRVVLFFGLVWPALIAAPLVVTYLSFRHLYVGVAGFAVGLVALLARQVRPGAQFAAAAAAAFALCAGQLAVELPRFREAMEQSRQISALVDRVARQAAPGDVLILDVTPRDRNTWVWAWASPFALRPPFTQRNLTVDLIVLEQPRVYRSPESWPRKETAARLGKADGDGWLISTVNGELTLQQLSEHGMESLRSTPRLTGLDSFEDVVEGLVEPEPVAEDGATAPVAPTRTTCPP